LVGVVGGDGVGDGEAGFWIDSCVAHRALEGVVGVGAFEGYEAVYEPGGWGGLVCVS
jgi:hypothetical protein